VTGSLATSLENGEYLVNWNIIGADGHSVDGEFSFTVNVSASEMIPESENATNQQNSSQNETGHEQADDNIANEQIKAKNEDNSPSYLIPVIIIVLIAIVVGIFFGLSRKK